MILFSALSIKLSHAIGQCTNLLLTIQSKDSYLIIRDDVKGVYSMKWVIFAVLIALILLIFSFRCSLPLLDRICRAPIIRRFPSVGISDKEGELDA